MQSKSLTTYESGGHRWVALHQGDKVPYPLQLPDPPADSPDYWLEWFNACDACFWLLEQQIDREGK